MLARSIAAWYGIPYIVKITDLAAQAALDVGIVKSGLLLRFLDRFEYASYRYAQGAIVICDGFKEALERHGFTSERIRIIRDSVDLEVVRPLKDGNGFRVAHGLVPDDFVVLYSGSMGLKQGLSNVVEAARMLQPEHPRARWLLVGEGELRPQLEKLIVNYRLESTVRLLPLQPEVEMSKMFAAADVLLLNQLSSMKDTVIPSKLLTYMAAGRPIIAAVNPNSQAALLLRTADGGLLVAPESPRDLAFAVSAVIKSGQELSEMGMRNRNYAEEHFDRRKIVRTQQEFLEHVVQKFDRCHCSL
jgi:colanic acid biosynthesis glycosyl transferase WcaI